MWSRYVQFDLIDPSGNNLDLIPSKNGLVNLAEKLRVRQSRLSSDALLAAQV
jgi:hypothetical protein